MLHQREGGRWTGAPDSLSSALKVMLGRKSGYMKEFFGAHNWEVERHLRDKEKSMILEEELVDDQTTMFPSLPFSVATPIEAELCSKAEGKPRILRREPCRRGNVQVDATGLKSGEHVWTTATRVRHSCLRSSTLDS